MPIERKLAAIMFTDIAGYTAQMSKDEAVAISLLNKKESVLKPLIAKHNGTYVKSTGDGSLSYFESAVNAASCAIQLQAATYDDKNMNIRIGIDIGDIVFKEGDVFGGGVNVASRLESIAPAGGVCVSKSVYDELSNQDEFDGIELGLQSLKGIGRLIEVYGLKGDKLTEAKPNDYKENCCLCCDSKNEVPSIAIIPFKNKGKKKDEFYAYGICSELISDVSSAGLIRVASKKQIEDVGDYPIDELGKKLDVRYIVNGELWRMDDMFQLSIELYDSNESEVIWSDNWQENWDNLPTIKGSLSDGLLKALDTKPKVEHKVETTNAEAYEFYLKANYKYEKRENTDDIEIVRGLLNKAIELDGNLISAKVLLGITFKSMGDYDKAMEIFTPALKQAQELGDKRGIGANLNNIGNVYSIKGDNDKALDYYERALAIRKEIGNKNWMTESLHAIGDVYYDKGDIDTALDYYGRSLAVYEETGEKKGMGISLNTIGNVHNDKGDYDKALDHYGRSLAIAEEIGDKRGVGISLNNIGIVYFEKGDYDTALDYYERALAITEEIGDKRVVGISLNNIGIVYFEKGDYKKAEEYLDKSLAIQKEIGLGGEVPLWTSTYLYLTYKNLGKQYDVKNIHSLIKETENIEFELNLRLYELLEDKSYLETAYNQVQEKADNLEPDVAAKFLSYPIPKAIVEEWEKVK